jgi:hypothetical protein
MLAAEIFDNTALSTLNLSKCWLQGTECGKVIGDMLAANASLKELDLSGWGPRNGASSDAAFFQALAPGLGSNGSLTKLDISNNNIEQGQTLQQITECCSTKGVELKGASDEDSSSSSGGSEY